MPSERNQDSESRAEVLSVSALNRLARETIEKRFPLLWVAGEVSNLRRPASGHLYFSLKDEGGQVDCAMFRNRAQLVPFRIEDGMRVEARALPTVYEARGAFQLNVEALRPTGIGALYEAFARLRARLEREGLFAAARKRALPRFPRRVGIVTSLQAAALADVLAAFARRSPHLPILVFPTPVQGAGAADAIAAAVEAAAHSQACDVLLVVRGGGSLEDLWAFNEEEVARALAASPIPVVAGIGHESDTTIADLVADRRAATPTAAAELASAGYFEAGRQIEKLADDLSRIMRSGLEARMQRIDLLARSIVRPGERLARLRSVTEHLATRRAAAWQRRLSAEESALHGLATRLAARRPDPGRAKLHLAHLHTRLRSAMRRVTDTRRAAIAAMAGHLAHIDPEAALRRGYSIVRKCDGRIVRARSDVTEAELLHLTFGEGHAEARVVAERPPSEDVASAAKPD